MPASLKQALALLHDMQTWADEHSRDMREGHYVEICDYIKRMHEHVRAAMEEEQAYRATAGERLVGRRRSRPEDDAQPHGDSPPRRRRTQRIETVGVGPERGVSWVL